LKNTRLQAILSLKLGEKIMLCPLDGVILNRKGSHEDRDRDPVKNGIVIGEILLKKKDFGIVIAIRNKRIWLNPGPLGLEGEK